MNNHNNTSTKKENNSEDFYRLNFTYSVQRSVFKDHTLTINDLKIYMIVRSFTATTGDAYPSNNWIANELEIDRRTVITCINRLIEKDYLIKYDIKGKRHLSVKVPSIPQEIIAPNEEEKLSTEGDPNVTQLVIARSLPSDHTITPPSDLAITLLNKNIINLKNINKKSNKSACFANKSVDNFSKLKPKLKYLTKEERLENEKVIKAREEKWEKEKQAEIKLSKTNFSYILEGFTS